MESVKTKKFDITGMTCTACAAHIEKSVGKLAGIQSVNVNLLSNSMTVSFDESRLKTAHIEQAVKNAGYGAHLNRENNQAAVSNAPGTDYVKPEQQEMKTRWMVSLIFLLPLLYIAMGQMTGAPIPAFLSGVENALAFAFTQLLLTLPIVFVNWKYFQRGFTSLVRLSPNMDSLIAIGSSAAIVYGVFIIYGMAFALGRGNMAAAAHFTHNLYFESGATILTLITLGKYLEARSKNKTSEALSKLMNLSPKTAVVIRGGVQAEIPVEQVVVGDLLAVKPGAQLPVDGIIEEGSASVDESALTGESIPVYKQKGDTALSASVNQSGFFTFRATKVGSDTTLSQIIRLVEDAASSKAPISKLADKISAVFVPVVIVIAVATFSVWLLLGYPFDFALARAIAVLVISCPCALGLATPVAIMAGTGKGAELGILIKSAETFETAQKIDTIVLDKTGTLTEGKPQVVGVYVNKELSEKELIRLIAALEVRSEHPLAKAVLAEAEKRSLTLPEVENFQVFPGLGVSGVIGGKTYFAGNAKLTSDNGIEPGSFGELADALAESGKTPLFVADGKTVAGLIAVADVIKPASREAVQQFNNMGCRVVMLTGDHRKTAEAICRELGIETAVSEALPHEKDREILRLQSEGKTVMMIGDGINDAPALMRADVGVAIGSGTDIAVETAGVALMKNDLRDAVTALRLGHSVMRTIKQNLFWAFFYNILGIPLAAGLFYSLLGWQLNPMFAAAAMSLSSVTVVGNALRLRRFKPLC
jgi:Cu+-exporting ATPase